MSPVCAFIVAMIAVGVVTAKVNSATGKGMGGWNTDPNTQYHIQTDEGDERYFRYQTISGQYRKEKRLNDGTVVGTYGWVDPNGFLRLRDYVADNSGYKVVRTKMVYVGNDSDIRNGGTSTAVSLASPTTPQTSAENAYSAALPISSTPSSPASISSDTFAYRLPSIASNDIAQLSSTPFPTYPKPLSSSVAPPSQPNTNTFLYTSNNPYFSIANDRKFGNNLDSGSDDYNPEASASIQNYQSYRLPQQQQYPFYDGIATTHNGFRYYLPRQYHEEENSGSETRAGSFGYIDPFGIRRVIYYNTAPGTGFVHKKNNRYVGFSANPYDPRF